MLSERDARVLRGMEQQLAASDPKFAATMKTGRLRRSWEGLTAVARTVALTLAVLLGGFAFWVGAPGSGFLMLLIAGGAIAVRRKWPPAWWAWFRQLGEK